MAPIKEYIETLKYKGFDIRIELDECGESPREWDNICVFHIAHRHYKFGDENYNDAYSIKEAFDEAKNNGDIVLSLYMYDHSGITISLAPFSCPFDSGQVGFVQVSRQKMIEEFGKKIFTKALKKKAFEVAEGEVKTMDSFLRGEVYGYVVKRGDEAEDSCWGYYDTDEAMEEAKSLVDCMAKDKG